MVGLRGTRRTLLSAAFSGGIVSGWKTDPAMFTADERRLSRQVAELLQEMHGVAYDDAAAEAAHYARAAQVISNACALPRSLAAVQIKAAAVLWCQGGWIEPAADAPIVERLMASIISDLLA